MAQRVCFRPFSFSCLWFHAVSLRRGLCLTKDLARIKGVLDTFVLILGSQLSLLAALVHRWRRVVQRHGYWPLLRCLLPVPFKFAPLSISFYLVCLVFSLFLRTCLSAPSLFLISYCPSRAGFGRLVKKSCQNAVDDDLQSKIRNIRRRHHLSLSSMHPSWSNLSTRALSVASSLSLRFSVHLLVHLHLCFSVTTCPARKLLPLFVCLSLSSFMFELALFASNDCFLACRSLFPSPLSTLVSRSFCVAHKHFSLSALSPE